MRLVSKGVLHSAVFPQEIQSQDARHRSARWKRNDRQGHSGCGFIQRIVAQEHKPSLSTLFSLSPSILTEALRLARRPLLLPADPGNSSYSRRSVSARWASSTRKSFVRFDANNTNGMIRQHYDNKKNNSRDSPGSKAER